MSRRSWKFDKGAGYTPSNEGKLPHRLLKRLLATLTPPGKDVIVGPKVGEDAFAARLGNKVIVASTDPITFTTSQIGHYLVNINANDIATMGARPRWLLATALLPPATTGSRIARLFREIDKACVEIGARLCGGHTEVSSVVSQPVVVGTMLGVVDREKLVRPGRVRFGDSVLLTKRLAVEGTAILARERAKDLRHALGVEVVSRARNFLHDPGISIVHEACVAVRVAKVHAMHDPTEGGLIWGLKELSLASGKGIEIDLERIPIYPETRLICHYFGINPLGLIASGSLLIVASKDDSVRIVRSLRRAGVECTSIGHVKGNNLVFRKNGKRIGYPNITCDEITKVLES